MFSFPTNKKHWQILHHLMLPYKLYGEENFFTDQFSHNLYLIHLKPSSVTK